MNRVIKDKHFILLLLLLAILSTNIWQIFMKDSLGVIDVQQIISSQAQKLAVLYPKGNVPEVRLQPLIDRLRKTVEIYAHKNRLTLLSKSSILGGVLPDYTEVILEQLKEVEE